MDLNRTAEPAQYADWIFCLVRTDPLARAQAGVSFLLIDMHSSGITVRPIIAMDGAHEVNEVWFEDVQVPLANRVGEEDRGWTDASFLLGHERTNIAGIGSSKRELERLKQILSTTSSSSFEAFRKERERELRNRRRRRRHYPEQSAHQWARS